MPRATKASAPSAAAPPGAPAATSSRGPGAPAARTSASKSSAARSSAASATPAKAAPGGKAAPPKAASRGGAKAPSDKFLAEQRALLVAERATYEEQAESLKAEADQMAREMEPGDIQFDDESGEGASANVDRERDLALSAQARAAVDEIDRALAKIDAGTYGVCEGCGQPIVRARLKALPHARLCVACKSGGLSRR